MGGEATIGRYVVVRRLGSGGMAEVYLCRQRGIGGFDKLVVIKRMLPEVQSNPMYVDMFLDEARVASNLSHPNVIHIFEIDEAEGLPYIAMEYVPGPTLGTVLQAIPPGPRPLGQLAFLFAEIAAGLHHAHTATDPEHQPLGIVHRDISPQNVIVSLEGVAKVFDFGVAKARGNIALTTVGSIKGKIGYMAPEQLRGRPVDYHADVYAFGVCLYEAMVGARPFRASTDAELFGARLHDEYVRPCELDYSFPPELDQIIVACMDSAPERRPSCDQLQIALARFAASCQIDAAAVAAWLHALFPNHEARELNGAGYSSQPSLSRDRQALLGSAPTAGPVSSPPRSRLPLILGVAIGLSGLAAAGYLVLSSRIDAMASQPAAPSVAERTMLAPVTPDAGAALLDPPGRDDARSAQLEDAAAPATQVDPELALAPLRTEAQTALAAHDRRGALAATDAILALAPDDKLGRELAATARALPATSPNREATGELALQTRPGARISVDGQLISDHGGALIRRPLARGKHTLDVALKDFEPEHQTFTIVAGRATPIRIELRPASVPVVAREPVVAAAPPIPPVVTPAPPIDAGVEVAQPALRPDAGAVARPPAGPGTLDATPSISGVKIVGPLTTTAVNDALAHIIDELRSCYRTAAQRAGQTPAVTARISFEIDESRSIRNVQAAIRDGDVLRLTACVKDAVTHVRSRDAPDVGTVEVSATVQFRPTK